MLGLAKFNGLSRYLAPAAGNNDANWSDVMLLIHADGANAGTVFTDSSTANRTITRGGTVTTSTTNPKFGTASLLFDATRNNGDRLSLAANTDFNLNITNWTWEFWAYNTTSHANNNALANRRTTSTASGWVMTSTGLRAKINGTWGDTQIYVTAPSLNAWHHYAFVKNGTTITMFINGLAVGAKTGVNSIDDQTSTNISIGNATGAAANENEWAGYIDEVRFTRNIARYTSDFSVPTAAYPNS